MAFIDTVAEEDATGDVAAIYDGERARVGHVPNYARAFSGRPDVYTAWRGLVGAIKGGMDERRFELVTLAAARELRSSYCMLAHGTILADRFLGAERVRDVAVDHRAAELDEVEVAVMDFAAKVVDDASAITAADVGRLRSLGLSDRDVFDVVVAATSRCFFSKTLDALGALPDPGYAELEPALREALTVGRPIATV